MLYISRSIFFIIW